MKKRIVALLAGAMLMMATSAMATLIDGSINFIGGMSLVGGTTLPTATGINFSYAMVSDGSTGVYANVPGLPTGITNVTFKNFSYSPTFSAVTPLWTFTSGGSTFDFDLLSISSITATSISGIGVLGATNYEATKGFWELTTQSGSGKLSFSAVSAVPEPGTMVLFGMGMLGMAIYGKRRMNKQA